MSRSTKSVFEGPAFLEVTLPPPPGWPTRIADVLGPRDRLREAVETAIEPLGGQLDGAGVDINSGVADFTCSGPALEPMFAAACVAIERTGAPVGTLIRAYLPQGHRLTRRW